MERTGRLTRLITNRFLLLTILLLITFFISFLSCRQPFIYDNSIKHTGYNNYLIFKNSAVHLFKGENLYAACPDEQFDLF
jgi:hypothetical protein